MEIRASAWRNGIASRVGYQQADADMWNAALDFRCGVVPGDDLTRQMPEPRMVSLSAMQSAFDYQAPCPTRRATNPREE